jgi:hypothetical protein
MKILRQFFYYTFLITFPNFIDCNEEVNFLPQKTREHVPINSMLDSIIGLKNYKRSKLTFLFFSDTLIDLREKKTRLNKIFRLVDHEFKLLRFYI